MEQSSENLSAQAQVQADAEPVTSEGAVASGQTSDGSVSGSDSEGGEPDAGLTMADALADAAGTPRPDNPTPEATAAQQAEVAASMRLPQGHVITSNDMATLSAMAMRVPIVGMPVQFWASDGTGPWPARVDHVWGDQCVNVLALVDGRVGVFTSVLVRRDGDEQPSGYFVRFIDSDSGVPTLDELHMMLEAQNRPPEAVRAVPVVSVRHLHIAQGLPEVSVGESEAECAFEPDTIQAFKATDGRTMRVVFLGPERGLACKAVTR